MTNLAHGIIEVAEDDLIPRVEDFKNGHHQVREERPRRILGCLRQGSQHFAHLCMFSRG